MANYEVRELRDPETWNTYVSRSATATQYHRYEWLTIIERSFRHAVYPLAARDAGQVSGIFPLVHMRSRVFGNFVVSLPFVNYGGILADSEEIRTLLWNEAVRLASRWGATYLESREFEPNGCAEYKKEHKVTMVLPLASTTEAQWAGFDPKLRNQIRKAERSGLTIRVGGSQDLVGFYDVFAHNMRDLGTPVYDRGFFTEIFRCLPRAAQIYSVCFKDTVIGACLTLTHGKTVEVPWASSLREYRGMCPNNLMYWAVIQAAIKLGLSSLDFGRSTVGEGTYKFKAQWGASPIPLCWNYWLQNPEMVPDLTTKNRKYQLAIACWKRLPVWLTKQVGPRIVRSIP
jgi:FemAB-related protein (PEP-CTERM system-associated)